MPGYAISNGQAAVLIGGAIILSPVLLVGGALYAAGAGVVAASRKLADLHRRGTIHQQRRFDIQSRQLDAAMQLHEAVAKEVGEDALQENIRLLFAEVSKPSPTFQALLSLGAALFLDGDYLVAERYLVEAAKRGEDDATGPIQLGGARHMLGMVLVRQADFLGAESAFTAAAQTLRFAADLHAAKDATAGDSRDAAARPYAVNPAESEYEAAYAAVIYHQHRGMQRTNSFRMDASNPSVSVYTTVPKPADPHTASFIDDPYINPRDAPLGKMITLADRMEAAIMSLETESSAAEEVGTVDMRIMLASTLFWTQYKRNCAADDGKENAQVASIRQGLLVKAQGIIDDVLRRLLTSPSGTALPLGIDGLLEQVTMDHPHASTIALALSVRSQLHFDVGMESNCRGLQRKAKELDPSVFTVDLYDNSQLYAPWPLPTAHGNGSIGAHEWTEVYLHRPHWCSQCGKFITLAQNAEKVFQCSRCSFIAHRECQHDATHCLANVVFVPEVGSQVYLYGDKRVHTVTSVDPGRLVVRTDLDHVVQVARIRGPVTWSSVPAMGAHHHTFHAVQLHKPTWCAACGKFIRSLKAMRCDLCAKVVHDACVATVEGALTPNAAVAAAAS